MVLDQPQTAIMIIAETEAKIPEEVRREIRRRLEIESGRRVRSEYSSPAALKRRLEMIQTCREELDIPTDSNSLPYPDRRNDVA